MKKSTKIAQTGEASGWDKSKMLTWGQLPWTIKLRFFNFWFVYANVLSFLTAAEIISLEIPALYAHASFKYSWAWDPSHPLSMLSNFYWVLAACWRGSIWCATLNSNRSTLYLFVAFSVCLYLHVLIKALGNGLPFVFRFIIGAFPMFLGYALFGMLLFSEFTERVRNWLLLTAMLVCYIGWVSDYIVQSAKWWRSSKHL